MLAAKASSHCSQMLSPLERVVADLECFAVDAVKIYVIDVAWFHEHVASQTLHMPFSNIN